MSDVLSRILAGVLGGAGVPGSRGDAAETSLGRPHLPAEEAGRFGGRSMPRQDNPAGGLGGMLGGALGGGGLGSILGGLLGGGALGGMARRGGGLGGLAGGLGGIKGVALMALLAYLMRGRGGASGLASLTEQLRGAGLGDKVDSWVRQGPNEELRPDELARAIPPEALDEVSTHTGLGRDEILSELSRGLPQMVDRLTPQGRLPEQDRDLPEQDPDDLLSGFGIGPTRRS